MRSYARVVDGKATTVHVMHRYIVERYRADHHRVFKDTVVTYTRALALFQEQCACADVHDSVVLEMIPGQVTF